MRFRTRFAALGALVITAVSAGLTATAAPAAATTEPGVADYVRLYENGGYGDPTEEIDCPFLMCINSDEERGTTWTYGLYPSSRNVSSLAGGGRISSIDLTRGGIVALYDETDFRGRCLTMTASEEDLGWYDFDDEARSMRIGRGCVDAVYISAGQWMTGPTGQGPHDLPEGGPTSLSNATAEPVAVYSSRAFRGSCSIVAPGGLRPSGVGSYRTGRACATNQVVLYRDVSFGGPSVNLGETGDVSLSLSQVRSLVNSTGAVVSIYSERFQSGSCRQLAVDEAVVNISTPVLSIRLGPCPAGWPTIDASWTVTGSIGGMPFTTTQTDSATFVRSTPTVADQIARNARSASNPLWRPISIHTGAGYTGGCTTVPSGAAGMDLADTAAAGRAWSVDITQGCAVGLDLFAGAGFTGTTRRVTTSTSSVAARSVVNNTGRPVALYAAGGHRSWCTSLLAGQAIADTASTYVGGVVRSVRLDATCASPADLARNWDVDGDGIGDLAAVDRTHPADRTRTGVHLANAADGFGLLTTSVPIGLHATNADWSFSVADVDRDGRGDVVAVNRRDAGSGRTAVHVLRGGDLTRIWRSYATGLHQTNQHWTFEVGDIDLDGSIDLVAINRRDAGSGRTAVHVMSMADGFQQVSSFVTPLPHLNQNAEFVLTTRAADGLPALVMIQERPGATAVFRTLPVQDRFRTVVDVAVSDLVTANPGQWEFEVVDGRIAGIQEAGTASGRPEVTLVDYASPGAGSPVEARRLTVDPDVTAFPAAPAARLDIE